MKTLFFACLKISLWGGAAAALAWLICPLLRRLRLPSRYLCWMWLAVGARFLLPGGIPLRVKLPENLPEVTIQGADPLNLQPGRVVWVQGGTAAHPSMIWTVLLFLWAAGTFLLLFRAVWAYERLRRSLWLCCKQPDGSYGGVDTPFTFGLLSPRIYLPEGLQGPARAAILSHEKAHIRRRDTLTKPLYYLIACLHWWNPLVWLALRQFERCMEEACDEAAVAKRSMKERTEYCENLLNFSVKRAVPGALSFGHGGIRGRIRHLLRYRRANRAALTTGLCLVALCCTACVMKPQPAEMPAATVEDAPLQETAEAPLTAPLPSEQPAPAETPQPAEAPQPEEPAQTLPPDYPAVWNGPMQPAKTESPEESTPLPVEAPEISPVVSYDSVIIFPLAECNYISRRMGEDHRGTDFNAPAGTEVYAMVGGTVLVSGYHFSYGNYVVLEHIQGKPARTLYAHLQDLSVEEGQEVRPGQLLGHVGCTGDATGNMLHLELIVDGQHVDVLDWMPVVDRLLSQE